YENYQSPSTIRKMFGSISESNPLHSHSSKPFVAAKKLNPFGIKQLQTLSPTHPGWRAPQPLRASSAAQFARPLFSWSYKLLFPEPICFDNYLRCPPGWGSITTKLLPRRRILPMPPVLRPYDPQDFSALYKL